VTNDATAGAYRITGADPYEARTFMRFVGLESLQGRRVTKAQLSLTFNYGATGYKLNGMVLASPWNAAAPGFGWGKRNDVDAWAVPGSGAADWVTGKTFVVSGFTGRAADTRKVLLNPGIVQSWINSPQTNFGFVLVPANTGKTSFVRTAEDATPAYRPTLEVWLE
jgi:hypothetical protein